MEKDFHHPYEPYDIQRQFMSSVYQCLEEGKVGIFESPTGTGKSLSLICGSLTWLRDHKRKAFEVDDVQQDGEEGEPDWMIEHGRNERRREALQQRADLEARLEAIRSQEQRAKQRLKNGEPAVKRHKANHGPDSVDNEDQFVLDAYESDAESCGEARPLRTPNATFSSETQALMDKLGMSLGPRKDDEEPEVEDELKILYCSRTHSQLTQFSSELRKVHMPPSFVGATENHSPSVTTHKVTEDFKHVTLGSRKILCINPKVSRLGNPSAINERCLELQDAKTSGEHRCSFLPTKDSQPLVNDFRDHALAKVRDIEELGDLGKRMGICPYYASRPAIKPSEIVTLPYPLLLQKNARDSLNIPLKDHVVIIDEAHNLADAIAGMYSVSVTRTQLLLAHSQLMGYLRKFQNRLKGKNRVYIAQTVRLIASIIAYSDSVLERKSPGAEYLVKVGELTAGKGVDQVNLYKLSRYLQESKLARKVEAYSTHAVQAPDHSTGDRSKSSDGPVLHHIQNFLLALMNPSKEGRFFAQADPDQQSVELKYMLLDPTNHFREIVEEARAVILAGGTMSPMNDYTDHLLSYLEPEKVLTLSCGHVIPASSLAACPVASLGDHDFDFTFQARMKPVTIANLGSAILSFIRAIPDGVVVFFPSYAYLDHCVAAWKATHAANKGRSLWQDLNAAKPVFKETQRKAEGDVKGTAATASAGTGGHDAVLVAYSTAVSSGQGKGALLFAVINGTLSEGINFSDALGRGVAVVGMPFPNPQSAEWKARMQFVEEKSGSRAAAGDFYTNTCMRAVNQAVGRAIRHKGDYAAILLIDKRYGTKAVQAKLPAWIQKSLRPASNTHQTVSEIERFFKGKKQAPTV